MAGGKIFISYRRADSQWAAARLYDHLSHAFPDDHLFMDVEKIAPGQDFVDVLADQVGECDVFLALIGPEWLSLRAQDGGRRLDDTADFVRVEIASALERSRTLTIPILLDGAAPPAEADLPEDLRPLARRQFVRLTHEGFRAEAQGLTAAIGQALGARRAPSPPRRPPPWRWIAVAAALPALAAAAWFTHDRLTRPPDPARLADLDTFRECALCPEMVVVPAGRFRFGSPEDEPDRNASEGPVRTVTLRRFAIGRTELTWAEYQHCVDAGACEALPARGKPGEGAPASGVRFVDATAYLAWLNDQVPGAPYRLPSESEWEYAARAGTETPYFWGDAPDRNYANMGRETCCIGHAEGPDRWRDEAPVAQFEPNPWGLHDTAGNLSEWVADTWTGDHADAPADGSPLIWAPEGQPPPRRVLKGGSFSDRPWQVRAAARFSNDVTWRLGEYGVRIARDLTPR